MFHFQHNLTRLDILFREQVVNSASHHHANELIASYLLHRSCAYVSTIPQNRHTISQGVELFQPVRDEDDRSSFLTQTPHKTEQIVHFMECQRGGRLVHD